MTWKNFDTAASHYIPSSDVAGLKLHVRSHCDDPALEPVLFVHGATYGSRLYDIPQPGMSWLKYVADQGFATYALDIRGYGRSYMPDVERLDRPWSRAPQALRDIDDAVNWICGRHSCDRLRLMGGSWGSITTSLYTSTIGKPRVSMLVLYAPIYSEFNRGWEDLLADPGDRSKYSEKLGLRRVVNEANTRERWDEELPEVHDLRDDKVLEALVRSSCSDEADGALRETGGFHAPNGCLLDLWEAFHARPLYDPRQIECPMIMIRGGLDQTSTRTDAMNLFDRIGSSRKSYYEIANAGHFLCGERLAPQLFAISASFIKTEGQ